MIMVSVQNDHECVRETGTSLYTRAVFFSTSDRASKEVQIRGSQICASHDCAAPPPQPLPLSAPVHQS